MNRVFRRNAILALSIGIGLGACSAALTAGSERKADSQAEQSAVQTEQKAEQPKPQPKPEPRPGVGPECDSDHCVSVAVAGDLLFHEGLWSAFATDGTDGKYFDLFPLLEGTKAYYDRADLAICDFETPLANPGGPYAAYPIFYIPPEVADAAAQVGYDACTTATNHSIDAGTAGLNWTLDKLDSLGIAHTGTYRSEEESKDVLIVEKNGVKIGIIQAVYALNGLIPEYEWQVDSPIDLDKMIAKAKQAREEGAEIVLAAVHNGNEYWNEPSEEQVMQAHTLVDSGEFDFVYMHHAHAIQPIEKYNGVWISYGLGNSISETSPWYEANNQFLLLRAQFSKHDKWELTDLAWAPGVNRQAGVPTYKWCSVASDHPQGVCRSEAEDAAVNANVRSIVEAMGAAEDGLHEWLVTEDPEMAPAGQ